MPITFSKRALAKAFGVSEGAVRKAEKAGRIQQAPGGGFDLEACRKSWSSKTEPVRSKVRTKARTTQEQRGTQNTVRTPAAYDHTGTPEQREARLLEILGELPAAAASTLEGTGTPACVRYALFDWLKGIVAAELYHSFPHPDFPEPDWREIAAETGEVVDLPAWQRWTQERLDEFDAADCGG